MATGDSDEQAFHRLSEYFNEDRAKVYRTFFNPASTLEDVARHAYAEFLEVSSWTQKWRLDSYFSEWELVETIVGPFPSRETSMEALKKLEWNEHRVASLVQDCLRNRDDASEAVSIVVDTFLGSSSHLVQLFYTGDSDIMSGFALGCKLATGYCLILAYITD